VGIASLDGYVEDNEVLFVGDQTLDPTLRGAVSRGARQRCRRLGGVLLGVFALALVAAGCSSSGQSGAASGQVADRAAHLVWICRPGQAADPCVSRLDATTVTASGAAKPAGWPESATASKFDCFYVHGTESFATSANSGLAVTKLDLFVAGEQAAPLSEVCQVWAPAYRSQTWTTALKSLAGDKALGASTFSVAFDSVLRTWRWFLAHSDGRPIVLVGDSQGSAVLIHLISTEVDHEPSVLQRLLVAVLVGGNLQVPSGETVGATFTKVPLCTSGTETGCAIAFSSYPSEPPADSLFARPGQGVSLQSGQTAKAGQQVACVNPAALAGGTGYLDPYELKITQTGPQAGLDTALRQPVSTPWVTYPDLYSARCEQGGDATWLQVTSLAATSDTRPVVTERVVGNYGGGSGPAWGYHSYEYGLTLGNLLQDIARQEAAWESRH
jgi:hypothetical protein